MSDLPSYRVKHGGLMRCCLASLDEQMCDPTKNPPKEGDTLHCQYHTNDVRPAMRFAEGSWEWNPPPEYEYRKPPSPDGAQP